MHCILASQELWFDMWGFDLHVPGNVYSSDLCVTISGIESILVNIVSVCKKLRM